MELKINYSDIFVSNRKIYIHSRKYRYSSIISELLRPN